jgi:hypothetical protein
LRLYRQYHGLGREPGRNGRRFRHHGDIIPGQLGRRRGGIDDYGGGKPTLAPAGEHGAAHPARADK